MSRIKIDDLPRMEDLDKDQARSISGGGTTDMHFEPVVQFENPIISTEDDSKGDGTKEMDSETEIVERDA
jgi:hypothetical protein